MSEAVAVTREQGSGVRRLWQIDLWEISIVSFPMMDGARIASGAEPAAASLRAAIARVKG
jgi:hypothetical protein